jgi:hypothetical protein
MKRSPKWSHVTIALGVIAALAIASPALGISGSIKKAIKKEVGKQVAKATGPAGAAGAAGTAGTARAYARVDRHSGSPCSPNCTISHAIGVTNVTHLGTGDYCVHAPGIDARAESAAVSVDLGLTIAPEGNATAMVDTNCDTTGFEVLTDRQPNIIVRDSAGTGTTTAVGPAAPADNVGFTIVIP